MNWKKTLKITGITLAVLFAALLILPFAFKGKIVSAVQTAANKNLKATVSFNPNLSLSLIRNFPNLSLGIDDLKIVGKDSFANYYKECQLPLNFDRPLFAAKPLDKARFFEKEFLP